jgi:hypothetical protein
MTVSLITQRVIHETTDISVAVSDFRVGNYALGYSAGEFIYIGASSPFNNIWMELFTPEVASVGSPTIEVWYNGAWSPVVDVIDQTEGLTKSGRISWALHIDSGWNLEQKSETVGLTTFQIYNRYWLRMSWASAFSVELSYIGQKFSTDSALSAMYPDLMQSAILNGFKAGKINWDEQHFMASESVVKEIRKRNIALDRNQIFDWTVFEDASSHKVAEIVYHAFGAPYREHVSMANKRYLEELNSRFYVVDVNQNGHIEQAEIYNKSGWLTR